MSAVVGSDAAAEHSTDRPGLRSRSASGGSLSAAEVGELYCELAGRLQRIVRLDVRAPDQVIEDACQVAWSRLVDRRGEVRRETALSWLATTAVREALKLIRRERRELSLDAILEDAGESFGADWPAELEELVEQRERLGSIGGLPERQQRLVWLHGLGLSYAEMALHTGATRRTVERQLLRAKHALRASDAAA